METEVDGLSGARCGADGQDVVFPPRVTHADCGEELLATRHYPCAAEQAAAAQPSQQSLVHLNLLTTPCLVVEGVDVTARIKYRKGLALLAFLSMNRDRRYQRNELSDLLWPELPQQAARTNLRQVLHNLSKLMHPAARSQAVFDNDNRSIALSSDAPLVVDVDRMAAATAPPESSSTASVPTPNAMHVAEPPPHALLQDFDLPGCDRYMLWLDQQRQQFAEYVVALLGDRAESALARGHSLAAIEYCKQLEYIDPLHEPNQLRLIRLLASSGRKARALQQYDSFVRRLRAELAVSPSPAMQQLCQEILHDAQARDASDATPAALPAAQGGTPESGLCTATVVHASYAPKAQAPDERATQSQRVLIQVADQLRQLGGRLSATSGLGVCAVFCDGGRDDGSESKAAQNAARSVMANTHCTGQLRIGIYSARVPANDDGEPDSGLPESAELATRLSLIAEDRDIVVCTATLNNHPRPHEHLGEWTFRGVAQSVGVYRLLA